MEFLYDIIALPSDPGNPQSPKLYHPKPYRPARTTNRDVAEELADGGTISIGEAQLVTEDYVRKLIRHVLQGSITELSQYFSVYATFKSKGKATPQEVSGDDIDLHIVLRPTDLMLKELKKVKFKKREQ